MFNSLKNFVYKSVTGAFLNCFNSRLRLHESSDSDSDLEDEKPRETAIVQSPAKKINIEDISNDLSFRDIWLYVDNTPKTAYNNQIFQITMDSLSEINCTYKQRLETMCLNDKGGTTLDLLKKFSDLNFYNLNQCISLRILHMEEDSYVINKFEIPANLIKKCFRVMKKIMPSEPDEYIEVMFSSRACNILLRSLFYDDNYYINNLDVATETYALAKDFRLNNLQHFCSQIIMEHRMNYLGTDKKYNNYISYKLGCQSKCFIGYSHSHETEELHDIYFPLYPINLTTLNEAFNKDIVNTVAVESITSCFYVVGFELEFNASEVTSDFPLNIIYKLTCGNVSKESEIQKRLGTSVYINIIEDFKDDANFAAFLEVMWNEPLVNLSIVIEDIKPSLCCSSFEAK